MKEPRTYKGQPCPYKRMEFKKIIGLNRKLVKEWLLKRHYAHRLPSISFAFGLVDEREIIGVCTFGIPASPSLCRGICGEKYKSLVLEFNRLIIEEGSPHNSASYLIGNSIKLLPSPRILVSYADTGQGHIGYVYQATNWLYTGLTQERTDIFAGKSKHSRHYDKNGDYSKRQFRSAKHRYILFHKCSKEIIAPCGIQYCLTLKVIVLDIRLMPK